MLIVITIVAIIAGVVISKFDSVSHDQLLGTAQVVAADIAYARNLAVTNNSKYQITFDRAGNRYVLAHSGTNGALDVLPASPFHAAGGSTTQQVTELSSLPLGTGRVDLAVVEASDPVSASIPDQVLDVEFGPLGETTRTLRTTVWLSAGTRAERKFIGIEIDPITGLTSIGAVQKTVPDSLAAEAPAYDDPAYDDPGAGGLDAGDPSADDPDSGDPGAGDPDAGGLDAADPGADDPGAGDPGAGGLDAGDPGAGDPGYEEPPAELDPNATP